MSISTFIQGIRPPDAKFQKMYKIWKACDDAGIDIPKEVDKFFNGETPDPKGVIIDLEDLSCCADCGNEDYYGVEIDITLLPADIKIIRFSRG